MPNDTYPNGPSTDDAGIAEPALDRPSEEARRHALVTDNAPRERQRPPGYVRWIAGPLVALMVILLVCGGSAVALEAVLAYVASTSTPATVTMDKTFSVSGVPTLMINSFANVHIIPGGNGQITIHVDEQARALTHAQAQRQLDAIDVTITTAQAGNQVNIQQDGQIQNGGWPIFGGYSQLQISMTVTAPATTNLIVSGGGTFAASGFTGKLTARISAGNATLSDMTLADGSLLRVNAGSLTIDGALQPDASLLVEVDAGSADVTLPKNTSAHLEANASAGDVNVNGWNVVTNRGAAGMMASGDLTPNPTGVITIRVNAGTATLNAA